VVINFGRFDQRQLANIEQVVGPTTQQNARNDIGPWWLLGRYRDQPVWLGLHTKGAIIGIDFAIPLGGRPMHVSIADRRTTSVVGTPEIRTGDGRFDAEFIVSGWPAEVITASLDEATRHWLLSTYGGKDPQIRTEFGRVQIFRSLATFSGSLLVSEEESMAPAEIAYWIEAMGRVAASLVATFDHVHATIARERGPAAAQAWVQTQVAAFAARDQALAAFRFWVFGGLAVFIVLVGIVILVLRQC
jgi:hypothetical protein